MSETKFAPFTHALAVAAGLVVLTAGAAFACDCDGYYHHYRHDGYGTGNYSCYGGFHDCRYESGGGYYHDDYRDGYRYDGYRYDGHRYDEHHYDDRDRHYGRDYRNRDDRW